MKLMTDSNGDFRVSKATMTMWGLFVPLLVVAVTLGWNMYRDHDIRINNLEQTVAAMSSMHGEIEHLNASVNRVEDKLDKLREDGDLRGRH